MNEYIESFILNKYSEKDFIKDPTGYFYDLDEIDNNIKSLNDNMPSQISLYYAMKANFHRDVLNSIVNNRYIKGIEIASSGELEYSSKFIDSNRIIFTGPGKTMYELEKSIEKNIRFINVESIVEAYRIQEIAIKNNIPNVNVLLRINLNYSLNEGTEKMSGCSTKLGIDEIYIDDAYNEINKLDRITIKGIHVYAASGVLDYQALIKSNRYIFDLVKKIESKHPKLEVIDFGGGLGIDYTDNNQLFNIHEYGKLLKKLIAEYNFLDKEIIMELGTYLVGNIGYYTSKIIDIKEVKGHKHIILAGGVNHMGLPLEMRRMHPVNIIKCHIPKYYNNQFSVSNEYVDISGPLCMVSDKLSWNQYIEDANIGDIVVYRQAGAYCYSEGMQKFLMHYEPKEIVFRSGKYES